VKSAAAPPTNIDAYIAAFPRDVQALLQQVRSAIRSGAPGATEAIKYGIPTFVLGENLVHFGAFKQHIGFYPTASGIAAFREALSGYKGAKGSVQFPFDQPLPLALIEQITRYRAEAASTRSSPRPRGK